MRLIPITKLVNHEVAYLIKELWEAIDNTNKRLDTLADDNEQLMAQISAKAEQPKPLLAEAKVGDLCQRSNGHYTQFHSKHKLNDGTIAYYFDDVSGSTNIDGDHCSHECGNNIVSCEPLAPIGSAEWALQMMKLGKDVCRKGQETAYYHICNDGKEIACSLKNERRLTCGHLLVSKWGETDNDWQLYEPKPEHCTKPINPITKSGMALSTLINGLSEIKKSFGDSNIHFIDSIPNDDNSVTPTTSKNGEFGVIVHINKQQPAPLAVQYNEQEES